ncbi:hypothetical protein BJ508DRAFT_328908 [Ascobolus immersus RN42]|uniref:Uncharacterized protein n=1 Tax=Ascobolus immersus RN42 TaxID=1160509 RepID=A0A3N4I0B0_ASCIM|nr:hypothetical protein BJ508DRAFT_328908 [Ascobolus immersus RN42]
MLSLEDFFDDEDLAGEDEDAIKEEEAEEADESQVSRSSQSKQEGKRRADQRPSRSRQPSTKTRPPDKHSTSSGSGSRQTNSQSRAPTTPATSTQEASSESQTSSKKRQVDEEDSLTDVELEEQRQFEARRKERREAREAEKAAKEAERLKELERLQQLKEQQERAEKEEREARERQQEEQATQSRQANARSALKHDSRRRAKGKTSKLTTKSSLVHRLRLLARVNESRKILRAARIKKKTEEGGSQEDDERGMARLAKLVEKRRAEFEVDDANIGKKRLRGRLNKQSKRSKDCPRDAIRLAMRIRSRKEMFLVRKVMKKVLLRCGVSLKLPWSKQNTDLLIKAVKEVLTVMHKHFPFWTAGIARRAIMDCLVDSARNWRRKLRGYKSINGLGYSRGVPRKPAYYGEISKAKGSSKKDGKSSKKKAKGKEKEPHADNDQDEAEESRVDQEIETDSRRSSSASKRDKRPSEGARESTARSTASHQKKRETEKESRQAPEPSNGSSKATSRPATSTPVSTPVSTNSKKSASIAGNHLKDVTLQPHNAANRLPRGFAASKSSKEGRVPLPPVPFISPTPEPIETVVESHMPGGERQSQPFYITSSPPRPDTHKPQNVNGSRQAFRNFPSNPVVIGSSVAPSAAIHTAPAAARSMPPPPMPVNRPGKKLPPIAAVIRVEFVESTKDFTILASFMVSLWKRSPLRSFITAVESGLRSRLDIETDYLCYIPIDHVGEHIAGKWTVLKDSEDLVHMFLTQSRGRGVFLTSVDRDSILRKFGGDEYFQTHNVDMQTYARLVKKEYVDDQQLGYIADRAFTEQELKELEFHQVESSAVVRTHHRYHRDGDTSTGVVTTYKEELEAELEGEEYLEGIDRIMNNERYLSRSVSVLSKAPFSGSARLYSHTPAPPDRDASRTPSRMQSQHRSSTFDPVRHWERPPSVPKASPVRPTPFSQNGAAESPFQSSQNRQGADVQSERVEQGCSSESSKTCSSGPETPRPTSAPHPRPELQQGTKKAPTPVRLHGNAIFPPPPPRGQAKPGVVNSPFFAQPLTAVEKVQSFKVPVPADDFEEMDLDSEDEPRRPVPVVQVPRSSPFTSGQPSNTGVVQVPASSPVDPSDFLGSLKNVVNVLSIPSTQVAAGSTKRDIAKAPVRMSTEELQRVTSAKLAAHKAQVRLSQAQKNVEFRKLIQYKLAQMATGRRGSNGYSDEPQYQAPLRHPSSSDFLSSPVPQQRRIAHQPSPVEQPGPEKPAPRSAARSAPQPAKPANPAPRPAPSRVPTKVLINPEDLDDSQEKQFAAKQEDFFKTQQMVRTRDFENQKAKEDTIATLQVSARAVAAKWYDTRLTERATQAIQDAIHSEESRPIEKPRPSNYLLDSLEKGHPDIEDILLLLEYPTDGRKRRSNRIQHVIEAIKFRLQSSKDSYALRKVNWVEFEKSVLEDYDREAARRGSHAAPSQKPRGSQKPSTSRPSNHPPPTHPTRKAARNDNGESSATNPPPPSRTRPKLNVTPPPTKTPPPPTSDEIEVEPRVSGRRRRHVIAA